MQTTKLVDQININDNRFWNYTRHFTKSSSTISDLNFEGKNSSDDQTKANNYFISVLTDEPESLHSLPTLDTNVKCTMYNHLFRNFTHQSKDQVNKSETGQSQ